MNRRKPLNPRQLAREKILFRYSTALERGDFDTLANILHQAENDPVLERMIWEVNEVYRAEMPAASPSLTLSTNHNHRNMRENETMTVYSNADRLSHSGNERSRVYSVTLAAAVVALVAFGAILLAARRPFNPPPDNLAALQGTDGTETATASPFPPTVVPVVTATPIGSDSGTLQLPVLCHAFVPMPEGIDVLSRPAYTAVAIGHIPAGTLLDILDQEWHLDESPSTWFFVSGTVDGVVVQGWISARYLSLQDSCPPAVEFSSAQSTSDIMFVTATALVNFATGTVEVQTALPPCPTPVPTLTFTPTSSDVSTDPLYLTATAVVRAATATVEARADSPMSVSGYPCGNTVIYPCSSITAIAITPTFTATPISADATPVAESEIVIYPTIVPPGMMPSPCTPAVTATPFDFVNVPVGATPTAGLDSALRSGGYVLVTVEQVGDIAPGTWVRLSSAYFTGTEWIYGVVTEDGRIGEARESQLVAVPGPSASATAIPPVVVPSPTIAPEPT